MKHRLLAAISLLSAGCAGAEPVTVTPGQPAPAEVTMTPPPPAEAKPAAAPPPEEPTEAPRPSPVALPPGEKASIMGTLGSQEVGDAFGAGGLGAGGLGLSGGGHGDTIGLGSIGTLGRGTGTGTGYGFGGIKKADGPQIRISGLTVTNGLPMEIVRRIVRQSYGRYRLCYERGLQNNPKLGGDVSVKFVIEPNGSVSGVSDGGSTMPDKAVVACLIAAYSGLSFPKPDAGGKVSVTSPMSFTPAPPQPPPPPPAGAPTVTPATKK
ncbi:Hypothetical protein A7982_08809 [Minicystis rosea]|nr:Hypothetical protein A7982_08809 [Minicystis rosea]